MSLLGGLCLKFNNLLFRLGLRRPGPDPFGEEVNCWQLKIIELCARI